MHAFVTDTSTKNMVDGRELIAYCPRIEQANKSRWCLEIIVPKMGSWTFPPSESCFREAGQTPPTMGWLNIYPNESCSKEAGHTTLTMGWLKLNPSESCYREAGHTTPTTGWVNSFRNMLPFRIRWSVRNMLSLFSKHT